MKYMTMRIEWSRINIAVMLLFLVCCGCTNITKMVHGTGPSEITPPVKYYLWVKTLSNSENKQEIQKLKKRNNMDPEIKQIQLALLLSVPEYATIENEELAFTILKHEAELTEKSSSKRQKDYRQFALIWRDIINQRRMQSGITNGLRSRNRELEEENRKLLRQIEALKSIEQQINKREINQDINE